MNAKTLLLIPAALALGSPARAYSNFGFRLNFGIPLYLPLDYPAYDAPRTVVYQAPPSAVAEQVTVAPGPGYVWMSGHWSFYANRWVWVAGHWELPPSPSSTWIAGHWIQGNSGWVWVDGAWTVGSPPSPPYAAPGMPPVPQPPSAAPTVATPSTPPPPVAELADGTIVDEDPPAPIVEYVPAYPGPDFVWIGGFWGWRGSWYWNAGHFVHAPYRGAAWVSGGWARAAHGWAFHGGRWR
jgi:hypothetical protein